MKKSKQKGTLTAFSIKPRASNIQHEQFIPVPDSAAFLGSYELL
jgi:hypothetical protein